MKLYPNLAGSLRFYFGVGRFFTLLFGGLWLLLLFLAPVISRSVAEDSKLMIALGDVVLDTPAQSVMLNATTAKPNALELDTLRASLRADWLSKDPALISALRTTVLPLIFVFVGFTWALLTSLRAICTNIERREIFTEDNLRLVRKSGFILICFSLAGFAVHLWTAYSMNGYLTQHVSLSGLVTSGTGAVRYSPPSYLFPGESGLVLGFLILMLAQAFRQGLQLKTENDLTV
ncbi:MAG: DUF2975 domain-containing protein [Opitutus sp.]